MQNNVYSRYIYQMLMDHSRVAVPEMGTFILQFDQAFFGNNYEMLYPPKSKLYFSPSVDEQFILSSLLIEDGMLNEDASFIECELVRDYLDAAKKQIPFEFIGLGTLDNNVFKPLNEQHFDRYDGLKGISAKIIQKGVILHDESFQYYLKQPITEKNRPNLYAFFWPSLIAIITILCILFWVISRIQVVDLNHDAENTILKEQNTNTEDKMYEKLDSSLAEQKPNVLDTLKDLSISEGIVTKPEKLKGEVKSDPPIINLPKKTIQNDNEENSKCVVIVGAFRDKKNASKLEAMILAKGYEVFRQDVNGMKRVGVRYNCEKSNPEIFRDKIRRIFNQDAWHLHDTINF